MMKKAWSYLSDIGISPTLPSDEARIIKLLNRISFIVCIFIIGYIPLIYFFKEQIMLPVLLPEVLLFGFTFYWVKKEKFKTAKIYFLINALLFLGFIGLTSGKEGADKYLLIASSVLPLMLFKRKSYIILFFLANILLFFSIYTYQRYYPAFLHSSSASITISYYFNIATTFILIFFTIYYFKNINKQYEIKLVEKNKIIEEKNKDITDSINYAKKIQDAILPSDDYITGIHSKHFVLFKPKDIVSGDFYWIYQIKEIVIWLVADCTGHGVPGAFMSMLGVSYLNEIVRKNEVVRANRILNELRESVVESLQQKGKEGEQKDGMDIALCVINTESYECQFAGANNPLYIIRAIGKEKYANEPMEIIEEIKPDKMPIGISARMNNFKNNELQLAKGDTLYLFSDGFADQFGGPNGKKFKYQPFKNILLENNHKSMSEVQKILSETIEDWTGYIDAGTGKPFEQIDDICVLGIRI